MPSLRSKLADWLVQRHRSVPCAHCGHPLAEHPPGRECRLCHCREFVRAAPLGGLFAQLDAAVICVFAALVGAGTLLGYLVEGLSGAAAGAIVGGAIFFVAWAFGRGAAGG